VGHAGMLMPGMLPQLLIGLAAADVLGLAAAVPLAVALAHPAASRAARVARAAAAIGAVRWSGRRNRLSVGICVPLGMRPAGAVDSAALPAVLMVFPGAGG
jgi:hypothetical protein